MISVNFRKNDPAFPRLLAKKLNDLQSNIAGKSDIGHTHEITDVTGLQTALDGKVSTETTIAGVNLQDSITKAELLTALNVEDGADDNVIESITVNGNAATIDASTKTASVTIPEASQSTSGVMSSSDKTKLDNLETIKGIKSDEKIVSLTQNTDLLQTTLSIAIEQGTAGTADEGKTFIRLKGINNAEVSSVDASAFVIDGMLQSAEIYSYDGTTWTPSTPTGGTIPSTAGVYIRLAWNSDAGDQVSYLDVSTLIDAYTAGNGLELSANNEFSIKIDSTPGNVTLTTSANGLKASVDLSGKQDTLTAGTNIDITNNTVSAKGYVYDDTKQSFAEGNNVNTASGNNSHAEGYATVAYGENSHAEGKGTESKGVGSHTEGQFTFAFGESSHAEGRDTTASGNHSHAEGNSTVAYGENSHVEGDYDSDNTIGGSWEYDDNSTVIREHNESGGISDISVNQIVFVKDGDEYVYRKVVSVGETSFTVDKAIVHGETETYISTVLGGIAYGRDSHAEGKSCAIGDYSHAEGMSNAIGEESHTEGFYNDAIGDYSHAEGQGTTASGTTSHSEGSGTVASGVCSHAEGCNASASGYASHAEGFRSQATNSNYSSNTLTADSNTTNGYICHAEGNATIAQGYNSHAEGKKTFASGGVSHAEGENTVVKGNWGHAEGYNTVSGGNYTRNDQDIYSGDQNGDEFAHAEGHATIASGQASHAEGVKTFAKGSCSHAEGNLSIASGYASHAEGGGDDAWRGEGYTTASGEASHAEGYITTASGIGSHSEGFHTIAQNASEHAQGKYNKSNSYTDNDKTINTIHSTGIGTSNNDRKNAVEVMDNGDVYVIGIGGYDGTNPESAQTLQQVIASLVPSA